MSYKQTVAPNRYDADWMNLEFSRVEKGLKVFDVVHLVETHVEPTKPRSGDIRFADGSDWDPGSGQGIYAFYGGVWNFLG